jgi:uncharacterized protein (DUF58 family)
VLSFITCYRYQSDLLYSVYLVLSAITSAGWVVRLLDVRGGIGGFALRLPLRLTFAQCLLRARGNRHIIIFMKSRLRLNARAFPLIGLAALIMQILDPSRIWVILMIVFGGTWFFCFWWMYGLQRWLSFEREMRFGWAQVGDRLEERFTLRNDFFMPAVWVTVIDHSTLPDHHASLATGVDGSSTSQWKISTQCTRRGVYTLGGTTLETGDPFGIFTLTFEDPTSSTLAVMPAVIALPKFRILSSGWAGEGRRHPRSFEETINASHTREMAPGDPMRLIHWRSTARHDKFLVHEFEGNPAGEWWMLLDLDRHTLRGESFDSTEEHAVTLTASIAVHGLSDEHPVGLAVNAQAASWLPPRRNEYQQRALLKSLAVAAPSEMDLKDYLARLGGSISSRSSLLIVTSNANPEWTHALLPLIWRGIMPTVFLLDPNSYGHPVNLTAITGALEFMNVVCHVIPREMLSNSQFPPGDQGQWEWRVSGTGKAIAVKTPVADWRRLE